MQGVLHKMLGELHVAVHCGYSAGQPNKPRGLGGPLSTYVGHPVRDTEAGRVRSRWQLESAGASIQGILFHGYYRDEYMRDSDDHSVGRSKAGVPDTFRP